MRDEQRWLGPPCGIPDRGDAGPEHRDLAGPDRNRYADIGSPDLGDAQYRRVTEMALRAMSARKARRHLTCADCLAWQHWAHADHHLALEATGRRAGDVRLVNGGLAGSPQWPGGMGRS